MPLAKVEPHRRVVVGALQTRLLVPRDRRADWCRRRRTGSPPWTPRRTRSAAGWTAPRRSRAGSTNPASPLTRTTPSTISRSPGSASSASPAMRSAFARTLRAASAIALPLITAAREANVPDRVAEPSRVAGGHLDVLERHAELVGDDLRERREVALPLRRQPGRHLDLARRSRPSTCAPSYGPDAGALDVAGEPMPDLRPSARAALGVRRRSRPSRPAPSACPATPGSRRSRRSAAGRPGRSAGGRRASRRAG